MSTPRPERQFDAAESVLGLFPGDLTASPFDQLRIMAAYPENWTSAEVAAKARAVLAADLRARAWSICGAIA